jgi:enoyl-CoA hydratase/carnithine racemase
MTIEISQHASVTTLTFARPERKNAITAAMYSQLASALNVAREDAQTRVVILQGSAEAFTAGNDLGDFLNNPPHGNDSPVFRFLQAISTFPKPLIAGACGPAVGVGLTMLLHCDMVYAGDNAKFSVPFVNLGLVPEAASSLLLPKVAGYHLAAEKLLLGESFDAQEAWRMGIVNKVLPAAEVNAHLMAVAQKLATKPMSSLLETKRFLKGPMAEQVAATMQAESLSFRKMLAEPAAKEAFKAFMEKRLPDFSAL